MKQWLIIITLLLLLLIGGYVIIFNSTVSRAAQAFTPVKWQNVPLGEKKAVVHEYLGEPDTVIAGKDHWEQKLSSIKKYVLDVTYRGDTVSSNYRITYQVNIFGFLQVTEAQADSLK